MAASHPASVSIDQDDQGSTISIDEVANFLRDLQDDVEEFGESALEELPVEEELETDDSQLNDFLKKLDD